MEEREVDLISLLFHVMLHWRSLIVASMVGMLLASGYNAVKVVSDVAVSDDKAPMTISDEDMDAVRVYANNVRMYESMKSAWSESSYMALDGNNVAKTGVLIVVKGERTDRMVNIAKAYRDMAISMGAVDYICKAEGIKDTGIGELINIDITTNNAANTSSATSAASAYIGDMTTFICADDKSECVIPVYIEVLGRDADTSERMADLLVEYLNKAKSEVAADMGEHSLIMLNKSTTIGLDSSVINKQNTNYSTLSSLYDTVIAQKNKLSSEQLEYYKSVLSATDTEGFTEDSQSVEPDSGIATVGIRSFISIKVNAIGLFAGVFCMAGLWAVLYVVNNRIKPEDPIENLFKIAVIGMIPAEYEKKRPFGFVDRWIISIRDRNKRIFSVEEAVSLIVSRVKVQSSKDEVSKLVFIGCDLGKNVPDIPQNMAEKLCASDINAAVLDNVLYDPENTEKLGEMEGAVIIEKAGRTLYSELTEEIELLKRQQIKILGCVIVE